MLTSLPASCFGRSLQRRFTGLILYQLCNLDQLPKIQIHNSFGVSVRLDPKLPDLTLRHPLLLEIAGLDVL